ncbi:MAG TPA: hypothetical protein DF699_09155 [Phycisphaerales bacterium]|nr:hypothetical protein [Phycisphaerales bacterium]
MTATPTFIADRDTAKKLLRLSNLPDDTDAMAQFDDAMREAGLVFWRALGRSRIATLKLTATPSGDPNGWTDAQHLRVLAETTERMLIRRYLLQEHAAQTKEGGSFLSDFNDEGAFRNVSQISLGQLVRKLDNEISQNMDLLAGREVAGQERKIRASTIETDEVAINGPHILGENINKDGIYGGVHD